MPSGDAVGIRNALNHGEVILDDGERIAGELLQVGISRI